MVGMKRDERIEYSFALEALMRDVRVKLGVETVRAIETATGISASTISRMDNGKQPDMKTFMQLCAVCQLEPGNYFDKQVWKLVNKPNAG